MAPRTPLLDAETYFRRSDAFSLLRAGTVVLVHWLATSTFVVLLLQAFVDSARNAPPELQRAVDRVLPSLVLSVLAALLGLWLVGALALYGLSRLVGGSGGFLDTAAVGAWGVAPEVAVIPVKFAIAYATLDGATLDASDPAVFARQVQDLEGALVPADWIFTLVTFVWGVYVWTYGVARAHDLEVEQAAVPAVVVGLLGVIGSLL